MYETLTIPSAALKGITHVTVPNPMLAQLDELISEYGFYKTANLIVDAFEADLLDESNALNTRLTLAVKYMRAYRRDEDAMRFIGLHRFDLDFKDDANNPHCVAIRNGSEQLWDFAHLEGFERLCNEYPILDDVAYTQPVAAVA